MRTGALLTNLDSVGGFLAGLSVLPRWIVTTSLMATVTRLDHRGPLRVHGRVLRRGRNSVVAGLEVVDEGRGDALVAASTGTFAVLDPGDMARRVRRGRPPCRCRHPWPTPHRRRSSSASSPAWGRPPGSSWPTTSATRGESCTGGPWPCWSTWPRAGRRRRLLPGTRLPPDPLPGVDQRRAGRRRHRAPLPSAGAGRPGRGPLPGAGRPGRPGAGPGGRPRPGRRGPAGLSGLGGGAGSWNSRLSATGRAGNRVDIPP